MAFQGLAQAVKVAGKIVDEQSAEPLIGAAVKVVGKNTGTVSDSNGEFSLSVEPGSQLEVSYLGYKTTIISEIIGDLVIKLETSYELEQLIIKGVRAAPSTPVTQTNLSKKEIDENYVGQHPIFMIESLSPSITSSSESGTSIGNYGQIRLRGIGQERINFTLNGVPLNDMVDHGVFFSNITDISSSFNSIQVQRGVGTSAAGASSYAGSVNFESFNVSDSPAFSQVQLGAGSFGTYRTNFSTNTGVSDKGFGFYSSISRLWSDGFKRNTSTDATSLFLTGGYFGDKDLVRFTAFVGRSENGLGYYTIDKSILDNDARFNNLTANDHDDFQQYLAQIQYTRKLNAQSSLNTTLYYGGAGGDFNEGTPDIDSLFVENYFTNYQTSFFSINYPLKNDHYGLISNYLLSSDKWELNAGAHGYFFKRENREAIAPDNANPYYEDQTEKYELALFARAKYQLSDKLQLFSDVQFRSMSMKFLPDYEFILGPTFNLADIIPLDNFNYNFFNPRIGFTYQMDQTQNLYASFGRSGREPTRVDLLGGFQLNSNSLGLARDPQFEPEFVNNLELGYRLSSQKLFLAANLFYMDFSNEIAPTGEIIAFGVQRRINIPESYRAGVELEWNALIGEGFSYRGNLTAMDANIKNVFVGNDTFEDVKPILTPSWQGTHTLQYKPISKLAFNLTLNHLSESFMEFSNEEDLVVPGYYTIDFGVFWQISKAVGMRLMFNNVLDETYYTYGAPSDVDFSGTIEPGFLPQAPRNLFLSTQIRF